MNKSNKFNVGDTLLVKSTGLSYSTYQQGAERLGITNIWKKGRWASDHLTDGVSTVKVLSFFLDTDGVVMYGLVDEKGMGWVISEKGLELVQRASRRECVDYAKGIIQMDSELQALRQELEEARAQLAELEDLRAFKQRVMEAVE